MALGQPGVVPGGDHAMRGAMGFKAIFTGAIARAPAVAARRVEGSKRGRLRKIKKRGRLMAGRHGGVR